MAGAGHQAECRWLPALVEERRRTGGVRYRALAAVLRDAMATERIAVGSRLPPQRELAMRLAVGRATVVDAYNLLLAESLLQSRQGAGTWVVRSPEGAGERCPP